MYYSCYEKSWHGKDLLKKICCQFLIDPLTVHVWTEILQRHLLVSYLCPTP